MNTLRSVGSTVLSWLVWQRGRVLAHDCVLVVSVFTNVEVIILVGVSIDLDFQGDLVVDFVWDNLGIAVFHAHYVLIELVSEVDKQIILLTLPTWVVAAHCLPKKSFLDGQYGWNRSNIRVTHLLLFFWVLSFWLWNCFGRLCLNSTFWFVGFRFFPIRLCFVQSSYCKNYI